MAKFITLDNLAIFKLNLETLFAKQSEITKSAIGLDNVTNDAQVKRSEMGVANGVATLDTSGKVPSSQLPAYVDDVLEYDDKTKFPATGEAGKIYVAKDTNLTYRWSGTAYIEISPSLAIGTTSSTAAAGNHNHDSVYYKKTDTVKNATAAWKSTCDGDGKVISDTYYKKTDTVKNATNAAIATKATNDGDGNKISETYYKKTETVAKATNAVNDENGNNIATTYKNQNAFSKLCFLNKEAFDNSSDPLNPDGHVIVNATMETSEFTFRVLNGFIFEKDSDNQVTIKPDFAKAADIDALFA